MITISDRKNERTIMNESVITWTPDPGNVTQLISDRYYVVEFVIMGQAQIQSQGWLIIL